MALLVAVAAVRRSRWCWAAVARRAVTGARGGGGGEVVPTVPLLAALSLINQALCLQKLGDSERAKTMLQAWWIPDRERWSSRRPLRRAGEVVVVVAQAGRSRRASRQPRRHYTIGLGYLA